MTLKHGLDHFTGEQIDRSTTRDVTLRRAPYMDLNRGPLVYKLNVLPLCHYCLIIVASPLNLIIEYQVKSFN